MEQLPFEDRAEAGRRLASRLMEYAHQTNLLVLALPRGGVPVAAEVASALDAPLDVFLVRKLGVPGREELAMGAIAPGGVRVINEEVVRMLGITDDQIAAAAAVEQQELERRDLEYRGARMPPEVQGRTVVLVDDGLATGSTMRAAVAALRTLQPERLVVGVPVGAAETCEQLRQEADEVVCVATPEPFNAVGLWYRDFAQTTDQEVQETLARFGAEGGAA